MTILHDGFSRSRTGFVVGGILALLVGVFAIAAPYLFSRVLTQLIGALCLVSGLISLFQVLFGKDRPHRFFSMLSAIIRIAAGSALFLCVESGLLALTLILAVVFLAEGAACIVTAFRLRKNPAWIWLLLNGVVALILGSMVYARWPTDAAWVVGVLYGIQSLFSGSAMLAMGIFSKPAATA